MQEVKWCDFLHLRASKACQHFAMKLGPGCNSPPRVIWVPKPYVSLQGHDEGLSLRELLPPLVSTKASYFTMESFGSDSPSNSGKVIGLNHASNHLYFIKVIELRPCPHPPRRSLPLLSSSSLVPWRWSWSKSMTWAQKTIGCRMTPVWTPSPKSLRR